MRIDAHQHFWKYDPERDGWITDSMAAIRKDFLPADLEGPLSESGINGSIAVQADQSAIETNFLLRLADEHPSILGVVGWIDLKAPSLWAQLELYAEERKLLGFRHVLQSEPEGFMLQEDFVKGLRILVEASFTYDLLIYEHQMAEAFDLVSGLPDTFQVVIDHLAKPRIADQSFESWAYYLQQFAELENVHVKLSGMVTEAIWAGWQASDFRPYLDLALELFGPDRLMFGSDWPVCLVAASYDQVFSIVNDYISQLSDDEQSKILGGTAARFYNISMK